MPVRPAAYVYEQFPPFFEGLLPEGPQLEALLRNAKVDANVFQVGADLVGSVTVLS